MIRERTRVYPQKKRMLTWLEVQECIPLEEENEGLARSARVYPAENKNENLARSAIEVQDCTHPKEENEGLAGSARA